MGVIDTGCIWRLDITLIERYAFALPAQFLNRSEALMIIGERLRELREQKHLSQGQIEKRCGLLRCYISRVENGHTVPSVETLQKMSRALEIPLYQLFYEGKDASTPPKPTRKAPAWGASAKEARLLRKVCTLLSRTDESDRQLLLHMARKMANHKPLS